MRFAIKSKERANIKILDGRAPEDLFREPTRLKRLLILMSRECTFAVSWIGLRLGRRLSAAFHFQPTHFFKELASVA